MKSNLSIFTFFSSSAFWCPLRNHRFTLGHKDLFLAFLKNFIVLAFSFSSLIHSEAIFFYGGRNKSDLGFFCMCMLVVPAVFVDILSFLIELACHLYQKSIAYSCESLCVESQFHCVVVIIMPVHTALTYDSFTVSF